MKKGMFQHFNEQKHIIKKLRQSGAFSVDLSKTLQDLELSDSVVFRKLVRYGVIVHAGSKSYFLDERQFLKYRMNRVKWGMVVLFAVLLILSVWLFRVA